MRASDTHSPTQSTQLGLSLSSIKDTAGWAPHQLLLDHVDLPVGEGLQPRVFRGTVAGETSEAGLAGWIKEQVTMQLEKCTS